MRFVRKTLGKEEPEFQMAPMIDVIFLLLIFFMVISTFQKLEEVEVVKLPVADESQTKKSNYGEVVINVLEDGTIVLNQQVYALGDLYSVLSEQTALSKKAKITIRGDENVPHSWIMGVMRICAASDLWDVSFAAFQEEHR